jgi:hypothetical protein
MSRYGLSYYGVDYYGSDNPIKFDATPFTAIPYNYGSILLNWTDPSGSWANLTITRNSYGFPVNVYDGVQVLTAANGKDPVTFIDSGVNSTSPTFSITSVTSTALYSTYTYSSSYQQVSPGASVNISGILPTGYSGLFIVASVATVIPGSSYSFTVINAESSSVVNGTGTFVIAGLTQGQFYYYSIFVYNLTQYRWTNAGNAIGLSVKNYGNTDNLYNYLPEIYKISQPYVATSDWDNPDLYSFLSNFGFQLDYTRTLSDLLENKYNTETVSGTLIPTMLNQFGQTYEPAIGLQQNRILLREAVTLTKQKGSLNGLVAFIKSFTGWGVPDPLGAETFNLSTKSGQYYPVQPVGSTLYTYSSGGAVGTNTIVVSVLAGTAIAIGSEILGNGVQPNTLITNVANTSTTTRTLTLSTYLFAKASGSYTVIPVTPNPSVAGVQIGHNLMLDYNDSSFEESTGHWISIDGTADYDQLPVLPILTAAVTSNVATLTFSASYNQQYDVGNYITVSGLPYPLFNSVTPYTITAVTPTSISFALTSATNLPASSGYNPVTGQYGLITPYPSPWVESTAPTLFPNKANGIFALYNTSTSQQTINAYCGDDAPVTNGIPVVAGTTYCFSIYAAKGSGSTARTITTKIKWFDRFGALLSTSTPSSGTATGTTGTTDNTATFFSSYRFYVSDVAPTGAVYACPGVSIASIGGSATNEHHFFDAGQFEIAGTPTSFDDARQIHLTLRANRINELTNPNFASTTAPWTTTGSATAAVNSSVKQPNTIAYTVTATSISSNVATVTVSTPHTLQVGSSVTLANITGSGVTSSNYNGNRTITAVTLYTFSYAVTAADQASLATSGSAYQTGHSLILTGTGTTSVVVKSWDGSTTSQLLNIYYPNTSYTFSCYAWTGGTTETVTTKINWYDSSYTLISTVIGTPVSATAPYSRPYVTGAAPTNAAYASAEINWSSVANSDVLYIDQALFENYGQVLAYFDGSGGPGDASDFVWEGGSANAARSHYYKNKYAVQTRLFGSTLAAVLPLGSTAAVYLAQPQT